MRCVQAVLVPVLTRELVFASCLWLLFMYWVVSLLPPPRVFHLMCCVCVRVCAHIGNSRPPRGMIGGRGRVSAISAVARRRAARSGVLAHIALSAPAGPNRWFPLVPLYKHLFGVFSLHA